MYSRSVQGQVLTFTFSPFKYLDNLMLTDTETGSLWSQLGLRAVDGKLHDRQLRRLPTVQTTWKHWRTMFPDTQVFDLAAGDGTAISRRYFQQIADHDDPGQGNEADAADRIRPLELVLGLTGASSSRAYPYSLLAKRASPLCDSFEDRPIMIHFDHEAYAAWATDEAGALLPTVTTRWRVWQGFYPSTTAWVAEPSAGSAEADTDGSETAEQTGTDFRNKTPIEGD